jgi:Alcohol acetyltransferase
MKGPSDTLHKLFNELGLFSNIIVLASYHQSNNQPLTKALLFQALRTVISEHPSLSSILVSQPSPQQEISHIAWKAKLKAIDLKKCVSFIEGYDDSEASLRNLVEKAHNTWFDTADKSLPLWNVTVVNRTHLLFAFHHSVADGVGGIAFHRALRAALNSSYKNGLVSSSSMVPSPDTDLPEDNITIFEAQNRKASILRIIIGCLWLLVLRFLLPKKFWFFNNAIYSMKIPPFTSPNKAEDRSSTKLQTLQLEHSVLAKSIAACKKNKTSFTSLLATLIDVTLATDTYVYPQSRFRILATQVDCRRYAEQEDNVRNLASTITHGSFVGKYRKAGVTPITRRAGDLAPTVSKMDCPKFWNLAREYNNWLKDGLSEANGKTPIPVQDFMAMSSFQKEEEAFAAKILPSIGLTTERAYSLSNLGVFDDGEAGDEGPWRIGNLEFSVGSTKPCVGYMLYFGVVSSNGVCVINVTYNKGVLEGRIVTMLLKRMELRLAYLLENS